MCAESLDVMQNRSCRTLLKYLNKINKIRSNSRTDHPKTDKYLAQKRSQAKSSGIKIPEIHGANKGLDSHVKPGKQRPLLSLPIHSIDKDCLHILFLSPELAKVELD